MKKNKFFLFLLACSLLLITAKPVPSFAKTCSCDVEDYSSVANGGSGNWEPYFRDGKQCVDVEENYGCTPDSEQHLKVLPRTEFYREPIDSLGRGWEPYRFKNCEPTPDPCLTVISKSCSTDNDCQIIPGRMAHAECSGGTCKVDSDSAQYWYNSEGGSIQFKPPQLEIRIPGVDFSTNKLNIDAQGFLTIPYLVEYIKAVYKFLVIAGSIVAALLIILNGFRITTSAGGEAKGEGIKRVGQAIIGLFILWSSYAILYTINPALTELNPIKVKYIIPQNNLVYFNGDSAAGTSSEETTASRYPVSTELSEIFNRYSECVEPSAAVLKALAKVESGLKPNIKNSLGFTGLFQTKARYCITALNKFPNTAGYCSDLTNPEISTMVGTSMMISSLATIKSNCGALETLDEPTLVTLIYTGHQSGNGALNRVTIDMNHNCTIDALRLALTAFWSKPDNLSLLASSRRTPSEVANEAISGAARMVRFVQEDGGIQLKKDGIDTHTNFCPLLVPALRFPYNNAIQKNNTTIPN